MSDDEIEEMLNLKDEISILEKEVKDIEKENEEVNYLFETGQLLYQYYDNIDKIIKEINQLKQKLEKQSGHPKSVVDFFQQSDTDIVDNKEEEL